MQPVSSYHGKGILPFTTWWQVMLLHASRVVPQDLFDPLNPPVSRLWPVPCSCVQSFLNAPVLERLSNL